LRAALAAADANTNVRDEIIFAESLFTSGTPEITLSAPIQIDEPVWLHSPSGDVVIQKGGSAQEAFLLKPNLSQGLGVSFEIRDLVITNFKYGIRVNDAGGVPDSSVEEVKIVDNAFLNNERGIYFEDALFPFEIAENQILGRGEGASPEAATDAGIWIENPTTQTNSFATTLP
jgi:hypothetical protein